MSPRSISASNEYYSPACTGDYRIEPINGDSSHKITYSPPQSNSEVLLFGQKGGETCVIPFDISQMNNNIQRLIFNCNTLKAKKESSPESIKNQTEALFARYSIFRMKNHEFRNYVQSTPKNVIELFNEIKEDNILEALHPKFVKLVGSCYTLYLSAQSLLETNFLNKETNIFQEIKEKIVQNNIEINGINIKSMDTDDFNKSIPFLAIRQKDLQYKLSRIPQFFEKFNKKIEIILLRVQELIIEIERDEKEPGILNSLKLIEKNFIKATHFLDDRSLFEINTKEFNIESFLSNIMNNHKQRSEEKNNTINLSVSPNLSKVTTDSSLLETILNNIIGNSCKFTQNGNIDIQAYKHNSSAHIIISDNGIGIPKMNNNEFNINNIPQQTGLSNEVSSGLGLKFCRLAVHALGGDLSIKNKKTERGTITHISFPCTQH